MAPSGSREDERTPRAVDRSLWLFAPHSAILSRRRDSLFCGVSSHEPRRFPLRTAGPSPRPAPRTGGRCATRPHRPPWRPHLHRRRQADRRRRARRRARARSSPSAGSDTRHPAGTPRSSTWPARRSSPAWSIRIRTSASIRGRRCRPTPTATRGPAPCSRACGPSTPSSPTTPASAWPSPAASPRPTSCPAAATSSAARRSTSSCAAPPSRPCASAGLQVLGGLKMANGENPKNFNFTRGKMPPGTRMKMAALQREQFVKAREYQTAVGRLSQGQGRRQGSDAAGTRHRPGAARRGAGTQAHRPLPLPSRRRPHDRRAPGRGVRLRAGAAALHRGLSHRRRAGQAQDPGVADAGRQPRRQAGGGRPARGERRHPRQGRRQGGDQHRRLHHRIALLPAHRGHRRARRHVRGRGPAGADHQRRPDAAPRRPPRLAGEGQGRRLRRPVRPAVQRLHAGAGDVHRRRQASSTAARHAGLDLPGRRLRPGRPRAPAEDAGRRRSRRRPCKRPGIAGGRSRRSRGARSATPSSPAASTPSARARSATASSWSRTARSSGRPARQDRRCRRTCRC